MITRKEQSGFTLIGTLLALSVAIGALPFAHKVMDREATNRLAEAAGHDLAKLAGGMRHYIEMRQGGQEVLVPGVGDGLDFFRAATCGGPARAFFNADEGYIPCHLGRYGPNDTLFGVNYNFIVTNFGTGGIEIRATYVVEHNRPGRIGVIASRIAGAAAAHGGIARNGVFETFMANVEVMAMDPAVAAVDNGRVLLIASNRPSDDPWLRTDGTNEMNANIRAGGNSLVNAWSIEAAGDLVLGNDAFIGGGTLIAANLQVGQNINAVGDIRSDGSISAAGRVTAGTELAAGTDVIAGNDVIAGRDMGAARDVIAGNNVLASNDLWIGAINEWAARGVYTMNVRDFAPAGVVVEPNTLTCPAPLTPTIFTSTQSIATGTGAPIYGERIVVTGTGPWVMRAEVLYGTGWQITPNARVVVTTKCS